MPFFLLSRAAQTPKPGMAEGISEKPRWVLPYFTLSSLDQREREREREREIPNHNSYVISQLPSRILPSTRHSYISYFASV